MVNTKTKGYSWNFYQKLTVTDTSYPVASQITINLRLPCTGFSLYLVSGASATYSFDGITQHGELLTALPYLQWDNRTACGIWLTSPASSVVRCEAWVK